MGLYPEWSSSIRGRLPLPSFEQDRESTSIGNIKNKDGNSLVINDNTKNHSHYTLAYDENDVTFSFFYPNYSRRSSLMFQCKLERYDKDWREPTYEHEAHFANLPSGDYTFKVRLVSSPNSHHLIIYRATKPT